MNKNIEDFRLNGYALLRGVLKPNLNKNLYLSFLELLKKYNSNLSEGEYQNLKSESAWDSEKLSQILTNFRKANPPLFGLLYDSIQLSISIQQFTCNNLLTEEVAKLMEVEDVELCATGPMLRMDPPNDSRNSLDWHQDSAYYPQNLYGENGVVLWMPLHKVNAKNGSIILCPGSIKEKKIETKSEKTDDSLSSEQYRIPKEIIEKYPQTQIEAEFGDVVVFNMDLIHRSGVNSSNNFRFVAGVRYHKMTTSDFLPGKQIYEANKTVGRMLDYMK